MSLTQPSLFDALTGPPLAAKKARPLCACGHELAHHDRKGCAYGRGTVHGGCSCTKKPERVAAPKPTLDRPVGAVTLMRPDTVRPKAMGWALVESHRVELFLDGLKTESPNVFNRWTRGAHDGQRMRWIMAGAAKANKARAERAMSAIEQCKIHGRPRPSRVTITRLSTGKLDDDNLAGALKFIRDGIAEGLVFDDAEFSIAGQVPGKVPLFYAQRAPGKRGVRGVVVVVEWSSAP